MSGIFNIVINNRSSRVNKNQMDENSIMGYKLRIEKVKIKKRNNLWYENIIRYKFERELNSYVAPDELYGGRQTPTNENEMLTICHEEFDQCYQQIPMSDPTLLMEGLYIRVISRGDERLGMKEYPKGTIRVSKYPYWGQNWYNNDEFKVHTLLIPMLEITIQNNETVDIEIDSSGVPIPIPKCDYITL